MKKSHIAAVTLIGISGIIYLIIHYLSWFGINQSANSDLEAQVVLGSILDWSSTYYIHALLVFVYFLADYKRVLVKSNHLFLAILIRGFIPNGSWITNLFDVLSAVVAAPYILDMGFDLSKFHPWVRWLGSLVPITRLGVCTAQTFTSMMETMSIYGFSSLSWMQYFVVIVPGLFLAIGELFLFKWLTADPYGLYTEQQTDERCGNDSVVS